MTAVLLSVRPVFAHALLRGTKTAEVRRRFPALPEGATLFIYSSSPDRAVLGTLELTSIDRPPAADVWRLYRDQIEINQDRLENYLDDADSAAVLHVTSPERWLSPVTLSSLRSEMGLEPAQSFRYLDPVQVRALRDISDAPITCEPDSALATTR